MSDVHLNRKEEYQSKSYRVLGNPGDILTLNTPESSDAPTKNIPNPTDVEK